MKSFLRLFCIYVILSVVIIPIRTNAQGSGNHLTMTFQNCSLIYPDTIQFDLMIMSDGSPTSSLRLNACSYGINFDTTILATGATDTLILVPNTSEIIPPLNPINQIPSAFRDHLKLTESPWTGQNVWGLGKVDVSDTVVTLVSGDHFVCNGCGRSNISGDFWNGGPIVINGVTDTISTVKDSLTLYIKNHSGTLNNVTYSVNSPNIVNPMIVNHQYRVGTFHFGSSANFILGTSPNFGLQSTIAGGHTNCLALVYIDTNRATTGFSVTGTGGTLIGNNGQREVVIDCALLITSINDAGAADHIEIAPNPMKDHFTLSGLPENGLATVDIYNVLGTKIYTKALAANRKQETINCLLPAGIYLVRIYGDEKQYIRKIVVQ